MPPKVDERLTDYRIGLEDLKTNFKKNYESKALESIPISDYEFLRLLGRGGFANVFKVKLKDPSKADTYLAVKVQERAKLSANGAKRAVSEKKLLLGLEGQTFITATMGPYLDSYFIDL